MVARASINHRPGVVRAERHVCTVHYTDKRASGSSGDTDTRGRGMGRDADGDGRKECTHGSMELKKLGSPGGRKGINYRTKRRFVSCEYIKSATDP